MIPAEVADVYAEIYRATGGTFRIQAFRTDTLRTKHTLPGFGLLEHGPAQAIGWTASVFPHKLFRPHDGVSTARMSIEQFPTMNLQWSTVVELSEARRALVAIILKARSYIELSSLRACARGAVA